MIRREFLLGLDTFGLVNFTLFVLRPVLKLTQEIQISGLSWANYSWTWPKTKPAYKWTPSTPDHKVLVVVRFENTHTQCGFSYFDPSFEIEVYGCAQRYPDDPYDRIWVGLGTAGNLVLSTTSSINVSGYNRDQAPTKVLQTAQYWNTSGVNFGLSSLLATENLYYVVTLFFAEIESIAATEKRNISMEPGTLNGISYLDVYNLVGLDTIVEYGWPNATLNSTDTFLLSTTADSLLGPMLNAIAINRIYLPSQLTTNLGDGKATFIRNN
jgi:hypothetical protein